MGNDLVSRLNGIASVLGLPWDAEYRQFVFNTAREAAARIEALEEALKPFAEGVTKVTTDYGDGWTTGGCRTPDISDLRRAALVYANKVEPT